ncbi:hypothetical protein PI125_g16139 [Phytophthora idaei]|nr:hypothetical protein PI125_g16139 [Phytophthora idaei]KAG3144373.1 hypothetical protein PI126_g14202 [Phytophthora idaei]
METETKPDIDFVPVEMEPMHKERWRSDSIRLVYAVIPPHEVFVAPAYKDKGSVFYRDHTEDKLLHVASTRELPSMIVIVEMLKDAREYLPHDQIVIHVSKGVELLNDEPRCRVYRLTLEDDPTDDQGTMELSLDLPTEAVLVALDDCEVDIKSSSDSRFETGRTLSLKVADDVRLPLAKFSIKLVSSTVKKTQFILTEIY